MTTPHDAKPADDEGVRPTRTERVRVGLRRLERATLRIERPINRGLGSARFNPLAHTGTLSILFFVVVLATGIYLTAWFQFGFEESYDAVERLEGNFVGRFIRALHRYASVALVVTTVLHGWRTFVQDRFRGARWLAWVSGILMLGLLWVIGVTGYWLLWDVRAQALNEILIRAISGTTVGLDFLLDNLLTPAAGSGWPFMLLVLVVHIVLSLVVGGFLVLHLIRLTPRLWFPPRPWLIGALASVALVSLAWPVGILDPAEGSRIPGSFPLDPFYLFLFPLGLNLPPVLVWGGFTLLGVLFVVIPWMSRSKPPPPIVIDDDRCTGCTLCVVDCPYGALEMIPRDDGKHRQLAVLVPDRCVSCGVCIGSCSDDALSLPDGSIDDTTAAVLAAVDRSPGSRVVIGCERLTEDRRNTDEPDVVTVNCAGAIHPHLAEKAIEAGASAVDVLGCPAADCANRFGNTYAQARLDRTRVPRRKRAFADAAILGTWVSPIDGARAIDRRIEEPIADPKHSVARRSLAGIVGLMVVVGVLSVAVTNIPYDPGFPDGAAISIAMDHQGGAVIAGFEGEPAIEDGAPSRLVVAIDGVVVLDETYPTVRADGIDVSQILERIEMPPGLRAVRVELYDRTDPNFVTVLFDDRVSIPDGRVLDLAYVDRVFVTRADAGRSLYFDSTLGVNAGCRVCHSLRPGEILVGPSLDGVATRAETRVPGLSAEEYLDQSIRHPDAYVVDGFPSGVMLQNYEELLTDEQIGNLVAFLLTLD